VPNSLQLLTDQTLAWMKRQDIASLLPGWIVMTETDIAEQLRARCMVARGGPQNIDGSFIALPDSFLSMESIRDNTTGCMLNLNDHWTGPNQNCGSPCTDYRIVGDCVEFLPHPTLPDPPDPSFIYQNVTMVWFAMPPALVNPQDTNPILDNLFSVYLFGLCKYAAMFELDADRTQQMDDAFNAAVMKANAWKALSDYSGAPLQAPLSVVF
jgi:hypothetical protein